MDNSWVSIKRRFLSPGQNEKGHEDGAGPAPEAGAPSQDGTSSSSAPSVAHAPSPSALTGEILDATGRQSEMIRVGMSQVLDRLNDIARLKDDLTRW